MSTSRLSIVAGENAAELDAMIKVLKRLIADSVPLGNADEAPEAPEAAARLEDAAGALHRELERSAPDSQSIGYLVALGRRSAKVALRSAHGLTSELPSAAKLLSARWERVDETAAYVETELDEPLPVIDASESVPTEQQALSGGSGEGARIVVPRYLEGDLFERTRFLLSVKGLVVVVDGDGVALAGWPDLSVLQRRDALVTYLSGLGSRATVDVVFDRRLGGPEAVTVADDVRVLLTSDAAVPHIAVEELIASHELNRPLLVVTEDRELASASNAAGCPTVSGSSLLEYLIDAR